MFLTKEGGLQCGDERSSCTHLRQFININCLAFQNPSVSEKLGLFSKKMTHVLHPLQIAHKFRFFTMQFFYIYLLTYSEKKKFL